MNLEFFRSFINLITPRKVSEDVQVSKIISHFEKLDTSPPNTIDSPSQRQFKRFGKKKEVAKGNEVG